MSRFLAIFFCIMSSFAFAQLENYFTLPANKSSNHTMRNIDFIYVINLDKRPEKYDLVVKRLAPFDIHPYRFSAINGWELPLETLSDIGVTYTPDMAGNVTARRYTSLDAYEIEAEQIPGHVYFAEGMTRGAIGTALSHLSVLQDAYNAGYETIWVLEDDVQPVQDPRLLSDVIDALDKEIGVDNWDILFTDYETRNQQGLYISTHKGYFPRPNFTPAGPFPFHINYPINKHFRKVEVRSGAYSMIIRRSGIEKLLSFFKKYRIFNPYDVDYLAPQGMRAYSVIGDIVISQTGIFSDNRSPGYKKPKK